MSELGHYLKEKRKEKGMSLEEIQEITKIRKRYLEAIEKGEYNVLPGVFYARAFIKSYAEAVGLDPDEVLKTYDHELPQLETVSIESLPSRSRRKDRRPRRSALGSRWVSNLIFYAFLTLIGFIIYLSVVNFINPEASDPIESDGPSVNSEGELVENQPDDGQNAVSEEPNDSQQQDNPNQSEELDSSPQNPAQEVKPVITRGETEGSRTYYTYEHGDQFKVRLEAKDGRVWFSLNNEETDEELESMELATGESREWDLSDLRKIRFKFGNTPVVRLLVNGQEVDLSGLSTVHHVIISYNPGDRG